MHQPAARFSMGPARPWTWGGTVEEKAQAWTRAWVLDTVLVRLQLIDTR
jgi:hypothetical protein